jgi:hypothetical protein
METKPQSVTALKGPDNRSNFYVVHRLTSFSERAALRAGYGCVRRIG